MGVTCDSIRAGALALVALAWLGGPAAAEAPAAAPNAEAASAPPAAAAPAEASPAAAPAPATAAATPQDAAAPAVDPQTAAALTAALDALVAADVKASPIGAGDWRAARLAIRSFYAARGFAPVWIDAHGLAPRGQAALARLERADEDALDLAAFALPKDLPADATPERLAEAETTLSAAVVAYAMQASGSRIVPTRISSLITAQPTVADPGAALAAVAAAADPDAALEGYNPQQKGYRDLRDQLSRTRAAAPPPPRRRPRRRRRCAFPTGRASALACTTRACRWCARASAFPPTGRPPKSTTFPSPRRCKPSSAPTACRPTAP